MELYSKAERKKDLRNWTGKLHSQGKENMRWNKCYKSLRASLHPRSLSPQIQGKSPKKLMTKVSTESIYFSLLGSARERKKKKGIRRSPQNIFRAKVPLDLKSLHVRERRSRRWKKAFFVFFLVPKSCPCSLGIGTPPGPFVFNYSAFSHFFVRFVPLSFVWEMLTHRKKAPTSRLCLREEAGLLKEWER